MKYLILFLLNPLLLFAQETKKVKNSKTGETYHVLKNDKTVKHGNYAITGLHKKLIVQGNYVNGSREGVWDSYNIDGSPYLKYDFTKKEIVAYTPGALHREKRYRITDERFLNDTSAIPPICLLGEGYLGNIIVNNMTYPVNAHKSGKQGMVLVSFTIDRNGKADNYYVSKPVDKDLDKEALRVTKLLSEDWLPATINGTPVDAEVTFSFNF